MRVKSIPTAPKGIATLESLGVYLHSLQKSNLIYAKKAMLFDMFSYFIYFTKETISFPIIFEKIV